MEDLVDEQFCQEIPKVELHAHLNGSLSDNTLLKLLKEKSIVNFETASAIIEKGCQRSMKECFDVFALLHGLVDDTSALRTVTKSVLQEFEEENVKYLELRSTPRANAQTGMTKTDYIETVLSVINEYNRSSSDMLVHFIPSVDRGKTLEEGWENVKLAEQYYLSSDGVIPGIDFSGNPYLHNGKDFIGPLLHAKKLGLKLAVHMAEIKGQDDEVKAFLALPPDRIGHGTYINESQGLANIVRARKIPLEICVTSNIKSKTSPDNVRDHHLGWWNNKFSSEDSKSHPCVLCTDDKGVFSTSLSSEYYKVSKAFNLSKRQVLDLSLKSIDYIFADECTKNQLRKLFDNSSCVP